MAEHIKTIWSVVVEHRYYNSYTLFQTANGIVHGENWNCKRSPEKIGQTCANSGSSKILRFRTSKRTKAQRNFVKQSSLSFVLASYFVHNILSNISQINSPVGGKPRRCVWKIEIYCHSVIVSAARDRIWTSIGMYYEMAVGTIVIRWIIVFTFTSGKQVGKYNTRWNQSTYYG